MKMRLIGRVLSLMLTVSLLCPVIVGCADSADGQRGETSQPIGDAESTVENPVGEETTGFKKEEDGCMDILFLGNSLMYYNDMPSIFGKLAEAGGKTVSVSSITKGSSTISDFASPDTDLGRRMRTMLGQKKWDYVVIEPSRRITPYENTVLEAEIASAKTIQSLAAEADAEVVLYSVWGNNTGTLKVYHANTPTNMVEGDSYAITRQAHSKFMYETGVRVSQELGGVKLVPSGYAFENLIAANTGINLYHSDERHPSPEGSYLAACTFYAYLFGEKTEGLSHTANLSATKVAALQKAADDTVIGKVIPNLGNGVVAGEPYHLLLLGTNLLDDYNMAGVFGQIIGELEGKALNTLQISNSTATISCFEHENDESNDVGAKMRQALAQTQWDAIVVQVSRRCTPSGADVEASELAALQAIWPLLRAETDRIYLLSLNGDANPSIFTATGSAVNYTKTGNKETLSAEQSTAYLSGLAKNWAATLGGEAICYGDAYSSVTQTNSTVKERCLGYLQACFLYNAIFDKEVPATCTVTNSLTAAQAEAMRALANTYCPVP